MSRSAYSATLAPYEYFIPTVKISNHDSSVTLIGRRFSFRRVDSTLHNPGHSTVDPGKGVFAYILCRRLRDNLHNSRSCTTCLVLPGHSSHIEGRAVDVWRALPSAGVGEYVPTRIHRRGMLSCASFFLSRARLFLFSRLDRVSSVKRSPQ